MREHIFVQRRQADWTRLEALLANAGRRRLPAAELKELSLRYRAITTDLAAAKSRDYSEDLVRYLNRTTARAYAIVHRGKARSGWANLARFFRESFPREVRASAGIIGATSSFFIATIVFSYWLVATRPANAYAILPDGMIPTITKSLHDSNFGFDRDYAPEMSAAIITNNIKAAMLAFAGGITTLGIFTIYEIGLNGLMVGGTSALFASKGFGLDFWATVAPHGVIELTAIQIAGAAGLRCAKAVIAPGRLRRTDALRIEGRKAGTLMLGVAAMLVVAGTIEGFVSPQRFSEDVRLGIGGATAVALASYFLLAGRNARAVTAVPAP